MLLLYTLIFDYLRCKRMHFVFIIAGIIQSITRKQSTGWRVPSAVIHSGIIIYHVSFGSLFMSSGWPIIEDGRTANWM
ncbi:hypothetical protein BD408DRAFT_427089 [Parasitella parasitica]|nr:hypothetical protein BD408DRAFT_427075 [Parasitella parasitica]KAI8635845.1 hypothetical protein BD408DRAFT_427089 [Parasitella parasitica]